MHGTQLLWNFFNEEVLRALIQHESRLLWILHCAFVCLPLTTEPQQYPEAPAEFRALCKEAWKCTQVTALRKLKSYLTRQRKDVCSNLSTGDWRVKKKRCQKMPMTLRSTCFLQHKYRLTSKPELVRKALLEKIDSMWLKSCVLDFCLS